MAVTQILAMVLAGGAGTRLYPLTALHAKPALPFANGYRIVDFALSNLVNSGICSIYVLAQYKPSSLVDHIRTAWAPVVRGPERFIKVVLPSTDRGQESFLGTADAIYKNLSLVNMHRPELVAVFAADHVYRMDVAQMAEFHRRSRAAISVAAVSVPLHRASSFGVIVAGRDGRIEGFQEKPRYPTPIAMNRTHAYASMGNYLFNPEALSALLEEAHARGETDFGQHILPRALRTHPVFAYDFASNRVPGLRACEEPSYWRDVGTLAAYRQAQADVAGPEPRFNLANAHWPLRREFLTGTTSAAAPAHHWHPRGDVPPERTSVSDIGRIVAANNDRSKASIRDIGQTARAGRAESAAATTVPRMVGTSKGQDNGPVTGRS